MTACRLRCLGIGLAPVWEGVSRPGNPHTPTLLCKIAAAGQGHFPRACNVHWIFLHFETLGNHLLQESFLELPLGHSLSPGSAPWLICAGQKKLNFLQCGWSRGGEEDPGAGKGRDHFGSLSRGQAGLSQLLPQTCPGTMHIGVGPPRGPQPPLSSLPSPRRSSGRSHSWPVSP